MCAGAVLAVAAAGVGLEGRQSPPPAGYAPGARVLLDAHNAYPSDGLYADRIDRALQTGLPVAIEQDLVWFVDPATGVGRSVVSHGGADAATAPTLDAYFFRKVAPVMEQALKDNRRDDWPLVTLNLDFKTNEPEHHAAVWSLLGKYEAWLTTAPRTADASRAVPLRPGPMLVLTGSNAVQQVTFHDKVEVGHSLRVFGAVADAVVPGADRAEQAKNYPSVPVETLMPAAATNYRRWANFPWAAVEAGGATAAGEWTPADADRLRALVARAHAMGLWIRFYTLNGHPPDAGQGWTASYNFGATDRASVRWKAAIDAGVDFIASDQYELLARARSASRP